MELDADIAYRSIDGTDITSAEIEDLSDAELVYLYEFFKMYCTALRDVLQKEGVVQDRQFVTNHISNMEATKKALKDVVQRRNLRIKDFYPGKRGA